MFPRERIPLACPAGLLRYESSLGRVNCVDNRTIVGAEPDDNLALYER